MTTEEFSNSFDTLLASYEHNSEFGDLTSKADVVLDEYEKSQFLTEALLLIVTELYTDKSLSGFESTEQSRRYLDSLIKYKTITLDTEGVASFVPASSIKSYDIDFTENDASDLMFITYESAKFNDDTLGCKSTNTVAVTPVRQDELTKIVKNPFRGPNASRVLRIDSGDREVTLISKYTLASYYVGYVSKPSPIILVTLEDLSIDGEKEALTCKLAESLHYTILERAVLLALASKIRTTTK